MTVVYTFDDGCEDKDILGNKGANLVTMARLGLPVPPGFVVSIAAYKEYRKTRTMPDAEIKRGLAYLAQKTGKSLGKGLQVSVRSSAPASMPGMMDTVLNVRDEAMMRSALGKVFDSWDNMRAVEYRRLNRIPSDLGTAAVVQAMVFGNADERSGTGVVFSRDPNNGAKGLFGEYLPQAQGEQVVSGATTPLPIDELKKRMPALYEELANTAAKLEAHFKEMQDIEFTIESGKLHILQTRSGKRTAHAAIKIAVDMVSDGFISTTEALLRVGPDDLKGLLHSSIAIPDMYRPVGRGLGAAPGAATGKVVFHPQEAITWSKKDEAVILVRPETSPDDVPGIAAASGVLTSRGGLTSHAAIVTRSLGRPGICGAEDVRIDMAAQRFVLNGHVVARGDVITIDGNTGNIYLGALPLSRAELTSELNEFLAWADQVKRLGVRANADTPEAIAMARLFGAEGVGLCRTERQFKDPERLSVIREFILSSAGQERAATVRRLRDLQKEDFKALFSVLDGRPLIIRLLDVPLHEFLPSESEADDERTKQRIRELREINPMMGHRGVRLGVTNPEIYKMQIDAICEAKAEVPADIAIMVPQVITLQELLWVKQCVGGRDLKLGIMMETVRACMRAGRLAEVADFFSFGTNDLTQAVYSFSREDAERKFLTTYLEKGVLKDNPFEVLDIKGVGRLMQIAIEWARKTKPSIEIGVCGEHAGDPRSIAFFHAIGVDYVSC
ncbi:MAG: putative PEP-binding protein, partial [Chloroflexota bacterium]